MALLTDEQKMDLRQRFEDAQSGIWAEISVGRGELLAAVTGLDEYFHENAAAINQAIPEPARSNLTLAQKSWLVRNLIGVKYGD